MCCGVEVFQKDVSETTQPPNAVTAASTAATEGISHIFSKLSMCSARVNYHMHEHAIHVVIVSKRIWLDRQIETEIKGKNHYSELMHKSQMVLRSPLHIRFAIPFPSVLSTPENLEADRANRATRCES